MGQLPLVFIQSIAQVVVPAIDGDPRPDVRGMHAIPIWDFEAVVRGSEHESQAIAVIEDMLEITEAVILPGAIMKRCRTSVRRFDTEIITIEVAGHEIRACIR